ncbi:ATP-binding protein [Xanthobacter sp. TB0136]|uniref:ATP-binding protein n=1 Tax=Xanthobacter sp. TB0136 TaxID=3459177 RepID=UPI00403969ED
MPRSFTTLPPADDARLRVITDALPVGVAYVDQNKIYRFANQRFAAAYGWTPEDMQGKHADEFIWPDAMAVGDPFFAAAHSGQSVDFIHPVGHVDGRILTVRTFLRPDIAEDGTVLGFYVCSINVTQQKQAEATLLQAQKMDAVGQLASGIAHDFNNLLAIILGNLLPLREGLVSDEVLEDYIEPSIRAGRQGARLTRQLLAIARRQPLRPERLDVEAAIAGLVTLLRRTLPATIRVCVERQGEPVPLNVDRAQFEISLLNLCLNARDAMPDGGELRICVEYPPLETQKRLIRIVVADTGTGMDAHTAAQVFQPFFTTKGAGKGTGLGLSMVWGFVRQSQGAISVESRQGVGTRFTILLPAAAAQTMPEQAESAEAASARQGLILLVDDNHEIRRTIRRQLGHAGYVVLEAGSGDEALELVRGVDELRALVTDVVMPGMSGFRLAREAARLRPGLHIILMTGFDGADEKDRDGLSLPVLVKPFAPEELVRLIEGGRTVRMKSDTAPAGDGPREEI